MTLEKCLARQPTLLKIDRVIINVGKPKSIRPTPMSHNYFQKMAELQSIIEQHLEKKSHDLKEVNSLILSSFIEFQKQKNELRNFPEFQKQNQALRKDLQDITTFANIQIRNTQTDMYWCEQDYIYEMENQVRQDIIEQEIDEEFENVPVVSAKKRVKKVTKTFDRKFVMNILYSNSKTTDKLPRVIIEQTLHSRTKPKYKNRGL